MPDTTETAAPPDAPERPAVQRFRGNLAAAVAAFAFGWGAAAFTWWRLWEFGHSLGVKGGGLVGAWVPIALLMAVTVAAPVYGTGALLASVRGRSLAGRGDMSDARMSIEDSRDRIWVVVGVGLSALVVGFLAYLLTANDGRLREVLFNFEYIWRGREALLRGFWMNVRLFVVAQILVLVWALLVAVIRLLPGRACAPIRWLAIAYTDVFRGIPAVIVIYLVVLGFALAGVPVFDSMEKGTQVFWLAILALVLVYGAYVAEVYRAGLESIHWSQVAAARSLGLSQWQTLRQVVIPQAVRRIIPPLLNDFVALQKDTALVSFVGVVEILNAANLLKNRFFNLSPVTGAALFFLVITIPTTRFVDWLIKRDRERTLAR